MPSPNNGLVVGTKRWLAVQLMSVYQCWSDMSNPPDYDVIWTCPVCETWKAQTHSGMLLMNHLHDHTKRELRDKWLEKTLSSG